MALFGKSKKNDRKHTGENKLAIFIGYWGDAPSKPIPAQQWESAAAMLPQLLQASPANRNVSPRDVALVPPDAWFAKTIHDTRYPSRVRESCARALTYLRENYQEDGVSVSPGGTIKKKQLVGGIDFHMGGINYDGQKIELVYYYIPTQYEPPYSDKTLMYQNEDGDYFTDMGLTEVIWGK